MILGDTTGGATCRPIHIVPMNLQNAFRSQGPLP